jgi:uncharacterized protein YjbI with pentapeptide repeats
MPNLIAPPHKTVYQLPTLTRNSTLSAAQINPTRSILFVMLALLCVVSVQAQQAEIQRPGSKGYDIRERPSTSDQYPTVYHTSKEISRGDVIATKKTIPADHVVKLLTTCPNKKQRLIDIQTCFIDGDIDLHGKNVYGDLIIENSIISGKVNLESATIHGTVSISGDVEIKGNFNADKAKFLGAASFEDTTFSDSASFKGAEFRKDATFSRAVFTGDESPVNNKTADFSEAIFGGMALFQSTGFHTAAEFNRSMFLHEVWFDGAKFEDQATYADTVFKGTCSFRNVGVADALEIHRPKFPALALFDGLHGIPDERTHKDNSELDIFGGQFLGGASFNNVHVALLQFPMLFRRGAQTAHMYSPLVSEMPVSFRELHCKEADFGGALFRSSVDFTNAKFDTTADFRKSSFKDSVHFWRVKFPHHGLYLDQATFEKRLDVDMDDLAGGALAQESFETWDTLEWTFRTNGNLEAANEALYHRRLLASSTSKKQFPDKLSYAVWGYGVRPWRTVVWMLVVFVLFYIVVLCSSSSICILETEPSAESKLLNESALALRDVASMLNTKAVPQSAATSEAAGQDDPLPASNSKPNLVWTYAFNSVWKPLYGYNNANSPFLRVISVVAWIAMTVLFVCLLHVLSNVSPLVHDLIGKFAGT